MIDARSCLATAEKLLDGSPTETDARRAISSAYYAMFHHVCRHFSNIVLHPTDGEYVRAQLQAYRHIEHGVAKARCIEVRAKDLGFPTSMVVFAETFLDLQQRRQEADYNPFETFSAADARALIMNAKSAVALFDAEPIEVQRALVVFLALQSRRGR